MRLQDKAILVTGSINDDDSELLLINVGGSESNIEYISLRLGSTYGSDRENTAWIKWGKYSYCYDVKHQDLFTAIALFFESESLGKVGNFIKSNGTLDFSDSPAAKEKIKALTD